MRPIAIANHHPRLQLDRREVAAAIAALDRHHASLATRQSSLANDGELSLVFVTDQALAQLHARFLDDPTITDVITFEGNPGLGLAGEICVSVDAAVRHVTGERPIRKSDEPGFSRELALYLVHGWLHLAGYDDLVPAKKRAMRRAEKRALALLQREGALPKFRLKPANRASARKRSPRLPAA
ncbi:MAG TPA: rRNA maturation RNase YbeY [Opitutaceae bacterium]|nr:rRNA maturation RNase YbeY [Opitutaceae bacterium]